MSRSTGQISWTEGSQSRNRTLSKGVASYKWIEGIMCLLRGSLRGRERLPRSTVTDNIHLTTINQTKETDTVYLELCYSPHTKRRMKNQKSRRLFVSIDWHEREPGFPRTASSCVLFAVSERSGGRWSFYGNKQKMDRREMWPPLEHLLSWLNFYPIKSG